MDKTGKAVLEGRLRHYGELGEGLSVMEMKALLSSLRCEHGAPPRESWQYIEPNPIPKASMSSDQSTHEQRALLEAQTKAKVAENAIAIQAEIGAESIRAHERKMAERDQTHRHMIELEDSALVKATEDSTIARCEGLVVGYWRGARHGAALGVIGGIGTGLAIGLMFL